MRDVVIQTERASGHRQRTQVIRHALENFVNECLQVKLKRLGPDQREKRDALLEAHQLEVWLADATRRAKRIRLASHTLKPIHPDAQGTNLYVVATRNTPGLVGTHSLDGQRAVDVVGNASAMDVARLLIDISCDDRPLLEWVLANDPGLLAALSDDPERAQSWGCALAGVVDSEPVRPASHHMAKQLFFPLSNGGYHLLAPLFPSTLVHRLHQIIHESYFGAMSVAAREAHRKNKVWSNGYSDYPDLVIRRFGGDSPQNISLLNNQRGGENWLLPSIPPTGIGAAMTPAVFGPESIFNQDLAGIEPIRMLIAEFQQCLRKNSFNSPRLRPARAQLVREIGEEIMQYAAHLQAQPAGWTADALCRLNDCEATWLDPRRTIDDRPPCGHKTDWTAEVCRRLAHWLAHALNSKPSPFAGPRGGVRASGLYQDLRFFRELLHSAHD